MDAENHVEDMDVEGNRSLLEDASMPCSVHSSGPELWKPSDHWCLRELRQGFLNEFR